MNRKVILYIAMSLDGFIASPDGDISFLSQVEHEEEDYGYSAFIDIVDTIILGRKTYDKVLSMGIELPYGNRQVFVLTHRTKPSAGNVTFYSGNLAELISELKSQPGNNIYCDGGAETVQRLLRKDLIDEFIISIVPILLGEGIRLFNKNSRVQMLKLVQGKSFEKGLVQLHYIRARD